MKRTKKVLSIIVLIITMAVSASLFSACNAKVSDSVFAFGTVSEISLKGKKAKNTIKSIDSLFTRLDVLFDAENEKSDVYKINHADKDVVLQISHETYELLKLAKTAYSDTDKTFNVATYPLSKLWRFTSDTYTGNVTSLPSDEQIKNALLSANLDSLTLLSDNRVMKTDKDLSLSFGAIAKGFAGDAAIENVIKDGQSGIDVVIYRYADVLLTLAECINRNEGSPTTEAIGLVNRVRKRAGLSELDDAQTASGEAFNEAILLERGHEFYLEGLRRQDLIRFGKYVEYANNRIDAINKSEGRGYFNVHEGHNRFWIPQSFIDESKGAIKQNDYDR